jgi:hypothetical protein
MQRFVEDLSANLRNFDSVFLLFPKTMGLPKRRAKTRLVLRDVRV